MRIIKHKVSWGKLGEGGKRALAPVLLLLILLITTEVYNVWTGFPLKEFVVRRWAASFSLGLLVFGPAVLMRRSVKSIYLVVVASLISIVLVAHFTYTQYAGGFLSVAALRYFWQLTAVGSSVTSLLRPQLWFFIVLPVAAITLGFYDRLSVGLPRLSLKTKAQGLALILVISGFGYGFLLYKEAKAEGDVSRLLKHPFNSDELVKKVGVINYTLLDVSKFIFRKRGLTADELSMLNQTKNQFEFRPEGQNHFGKLAGKNVIYLQLESFQAYLVNKKIDGVEITPNLNKLANQGVNFTSFHYMSGAGTSSDAEFVALNSLINLGDRATVFEYPNNAYYALPKILRDNGYAAVAMHGDSRNFWNRANTFPVFGYERYYAEEDYKSSSEVIAWGINDVDFFEQSVDKLSDLKKPYFAHLISLSSHTPFHVPDNYHTFDLKPYNLNWIQENYVWATHYTDIALGKFLDKLEAKGLAKDTAIFVTGDHEPFIANRNDLNFARFLDQPDGLNDLAHMRSRQVPFIIYAPGTLPSQTINDPSSHLDFMPTITNLMGIKTPSSALGHDLLNNSKPVVVRRKRSAGTDIEMIITPKLVYMGAQFSSQFADGSCYEDDRSVEIAKCEQLYEQQAQKIRLSDLVLEGNRLDLLR